MKKEFLKLRKNRPETCVFGFFVPSTGASHFPRRNRSPFIKPQVLAKLTTSRTKGTAIGAACFMNIVYCYDDRYEKMALRSIESVKRHNPDANILTIRKDKNNLLDSFGEELLGFRHVSKAAFLRLLIPLEFKELDRALYIDCDTVCKGSLRELYETPFEGNLLAGVVGHDYSFRQARELSIPFYFGSGLLLFNIPALLKENYFEKIKREYKEAIPKVKIFSGDETIINWVFRGRIKRVSEKYDYCYERSYKGREVPANEVVIWHVPGPNKRALEKLYES